MFSYKNIKNKMRGKKIKMFNGINQREYNLKYVENNEHLNVLVKMLILYTGFI